MEQKEEIPMSKIQITDFFVCVIQQYMQANFMYKTGRTKYGYG